VKPLRRERNDKTKDTGEFPLFFTLLHTTGRAVGIIKKQKPQQLDTFHLFSRHFVQAQSACLREYPNHKSTQRVDSMQTNKEKSKCDVLTIWNNQGNGTRFMI